MIIGLIGNLGRGKTLTMTMLAYMFSLKHGADYVVSNYQINIADYYVDNPQQLDEVSQERSGLMLLDEIWAWMNARKVMENEQMVEIVLNSRKRGWIIIYTVQDLAQADPILRNNTDYFVVPFHQDKVEVNADHDVVEAYLINREGELANVIEYNPEPYYSEYDTDEEVSSKDKAEMQRELIEDMVERVKSGEFQYKNEMRSYLRLHEDKSKSDAEDITNEAFRIAEQAKNDA